MAIIIGYERPIRKYLDLRHNDLAVPPLYNDWSTSANADTHAQLSRDFPRRRLPKITLKGKSVPVDRFSL